MPYEMKERVPTSGEIVLSDESGSIVEYLTGFKEFRVIKLEVNVGQSLNVKFNSFSILVVLEGKGEVAVEDYGKYNVEVFESYYLLPDRSLDLHQVGDEKLIIYVANCDI